ncbi:hypothetical protein [Microbacterium sp. CFH 31415]|uniref:hypothetical protein n=1 Tax=Microbacterium sp. CFH 31415 TaxID=2921732 RepID=UPI0035AC0097
MAFALAAILAGCAPASEPEPTSTGAFADEAEAFAAAEETYRAYVDALNAVDLSDPATFEDVYAWTTGEANVEAREGFTQMHADGWAVGGTSTPTVVSPRAIEGDRSDRAEVAICLDVSDVTLTDATGTSVVGTDRPDVQSMLVTLERSPSTPTGWAISEFSGREGAPACD